MATRRDIIGDGGKVMMVQCKVSAKGEHTCHIFDQNVKEIKTVKAGRIDVVRTGETTIHPIMGEQTFSAHFNRAVCIHAYAQDTRYAHPRDRRFLNWLKCEEGLKAPELPV